MQPRRAVALNSQPACQALAAPRYPSRVFRLASSKPALGSNKEAPRCRRLALPSCSAVAEAPTKRATPEGHSALLQGLGEVGDVAPVHLPWLLRLAHVKSKVAGGDSNTALQESARGLLLWMVRPGGQSDAGEQPKR